jgi:hypothetical protein
MLKTAKTAPTTRPISSPAAKAISVTLPLLAWGWKGEGEGASSGLRASSTHRHRRKRVATNHLLGSRFYRQPSTQCQLLESRRIRPARESLQPKFPTIGRPSHPSAQSQSVAIHSLFISSGLQGLQAGGVWQHARIARAAPVRLARMPPNRPQFLPEAAPILAERCRLEAPQQVV